MALDGKELLMGPQLREQCPDCLGFRSVYADDQCICFDPRYEEAE